MISIFYTFIEEKGIFSFSSKLQKKCRKILHKHISGTDCFFIVDFFQIYGIIKAEITAAVRRRRERERITMKTTLEFILLTQSPALFLAALVLLIGFFSKKKNHRVRAALNLIFALLCLFGGIALYYLGMLYEHFTIRDFWQIRVPGWVGLGIVLVLTALAIYRATAKAIKKHRADKYAAKAEAERVKELEDARTAAYESGKADAIAETKVVDTVAEAAAPAVPAADSAAPEEQA